MRTPSHVTQADPALLDDPQWLRGQYEDRRLGTHEIGRLVGRAPSTILYRLRKHGIAVRPQRVSRSEHCDGVWLAQHYLDGEQYVTWCGEHGHEPDEDGGHGLSTSACAEQARVSRETIRRWLVKHGIERRGPDDLSSHRMGRQQVFALGLAARAALRRFEAADVVVCVEVRDGEIRVEYTTGLRERWGLEEESGHRLRFPRSGWWIRPPHREDAHQGLLGEGDAPSDCDVGLPCTARYCASLGFLERRLLVANLVRALASEGWVRPVFDPDVLDEDLTAVLEMGQVHAQTPGYLRGQPGRPASGVPAGMRLAMNLTDWSCLSRPGGETLEASWNDPNRLYWSIESLIRRGEDVSREAVVHRLVCGRAEGLPAKTGPIWRPPRYWMALLRDVLGHEDGVIVVDPEPGCASKAVAVAAMGGVYAHPLGVAVSRDSLLWEPHAGSRPQAEIVEDDGICAHLALVECDGFRDFEQAVDEYGCRCEQVVCRLPWRDRDRVRGMPGARVIRLKARPYRRDEVIAIWSQGSGAAIRMATC